jgi:hypothetical protein
LGFEHLDCVFQLLQSTPALVPPRIDINVSPIENGSEESNFRAFGYGSTPFPPEECIELIPREVLKEVEDYVKEELVRVEIKQVLRENIVEQALSSLI